MGKYIGIYLGLEQEERDDIRGCMLHCQVQETLPKVIKVHIVR